MKQPPLSERLRSSTVNIDHTPIINLLKHQVVFATGAMVMANKLICGVHLINVVRPPHIWSPDNTRIAYVEFVDCSDHLWANQSENA